MGIIIDLKNAIRKSIYTLDKKMNFNFEEIKRAKYPFVFFYIPNYQIIEPQDSTRFAQLNLNCVLEYASEELSGREIYMYLGYLSDDRLNNAPLDIAPPNRNQQVM